MGRIEGCMRVSGPFAFCFYTQSNAKLIGELEKLL